MKILTILFTAMLTTVVFAAPVEEHNNQVTQEGSGEVSA